MPLHGGAIVAPPPTAAEWLRDRAFALVGAATPATNDPSVNKIVECDREAVPVLAELVGDPEPRVRYWAAVGLLCVIPRPREAVPALVAAVRQYGGEDRRHGSAEAETGGGLPRGIVTGGDKASAAKAVFKALEIIDPEAAKRAMAMADEP